MYQCCFANGRIPFLIGSLDRERAVGTTPCLKRDEKGSESHDIVGRCTISSSLAGMLKDWRGAGNASSVPASNASPRSGRGI